MKHAGIMRLLQLAVFCEEKGEISQAEDYLDVALAEATAESDPGDSQLVASRYAAFLRRQGRPDATEPLQLLIHCSSALNDRAKLKMLDSVRRAIYELRRSGKITSADDAQWKLANPAWVEQQGLSRLSDILNTDMGQEAIKLVFQETMSVGAIDRRKIGHAGTAI